MALLHIAICYPTKVNGLIFIGDKRTIKKKKGASFEAPIPILPNPLYLVNLDG